MDLSFWKTIFTGSLWRKNWKNPWILLKARAIVIGNSRNIKKHIFSLHFFTMQYCFNNKATFPLKCCEILSIASWADHTVAPGSLFLTCSVPWPPRDKGGNYFGRLSKTIVLTHLVSGAELTLSRSADFLCNSHWTRGWFQAHFDTQQCFYFENIYYFVRQKCFNNTYDFWFFWKFW